MLILWYYEYGWEISHKINKGYIWLVESDAFQIDIRIASDLSQMWFVRCFYYLKIISNIITVNNSNIIW